MIGEPHNDLRADASKFRGKTESAVRHNGRRSSPDERRLLPMDITMQDPAGRLQTELKPPAPEEMTINLDEFDEHNPYEFNRAEAFIFKEESKLFHLN